MLPQGISLLPTEGRELGIMICLEPYVVEPHRMANEVDDLRITHTVQLNISQMYR